MPKFNSPAYTLLHYSCGFFAPDANHSTRKPSYLCGSFQRSFQDLENTFQSFLVEHCSSRSCGGSWRSSSVHCIPFARGNGFVLSRLDKDHASCVFYFLFRVCVGDRGLEFGSLHLRHNAFEISLKADVFTSQKSVYVYLANFSGLSFYISLR